MHNYDDNYLARQGFEPGTSRLQALVDTNAPVDTNEPSGPANSRLVWYILDEDYKAELGLETLRKSTFYLF